MGALQKTCQGLTVDWFQQRNACSTSSSHGRMCSRTLKVGSGGGLLLVLPPICGTGRGFRCSQTALRVSVTWGVTLVSQCLRFRKGDEQWGERYLWLDSVALVLYMCMLWNNCLPLYSRLFITSVVCVLWNLLSLCSQSNKWVTVAESDILKKKKIYIYIIGGKCPRQYMVKKFVVHCRCASSAFPSFVLVGIGSLISFVS